MIHVINVMFISQTNGAEMLNEQFICGMFDGEPDQSSPPQQREDISLNLTTSTHHPSARSHSSDWVASALTEIDRFGTWMEARKDACEEGYSLCHNLIEQLQIEQDPLSLPQLDIIKAQINRKGPEETNCTDCQLNKDKIQDLESTISSQNSLIDSLQNTVAKLEETVSSSDVEAVGLKLVTDTQIQTLQSEVAELQTEITALRNEKATLERTFLFNKTRNSELGALQKSKNLSAAKNSTSSSQLLSRNQETLVLGGETGEGDIEEWVRFFEVQKGRYRVLCVGQESERQRDLGRAFTKRQRDEFRQQRPVCLVFSAIKEFLIALEKVKALGGLETETGQSRLTELDETGRQEGWGVLWEENRKLKTKIHLALKVNESLCCEKSNLQEASSQLRKQLLLLSAKVATLEDQRNRQQLLLQEKQEELALLADQIRKYGSYESQGRADDRYDQLLAQRQMEEVRHSSMTFQLKRQALERRRLLMEAEERKGQVRVICRVSSRQEGKAVFVKGSSNDRLVLVEEQKSLKFDRVLFGSGLSKLSQELQRPLQCVLQGNNLCILSSGSGMGHDYPTEERLVREIFRMVTTQASSLQVRIKVSFLELVDGKVSGIVGATRSRKPVEIREDKQGSIWFYNCQAIAIDSADEFQRLNHEFCHYKYGLQFNNSNTHHFLTSLSLDIFNGKTQQNYVSKINILEVGLGAQDLPVLTKCLQSVALKQNYVRHTDSKLTHLIKDTLSPNSTVAVLLNLSSSVSRRQETWQLIQFGLKAKGTDRSRQNREEGAKQRRSVSRIGN